MYDSQNIEIALSRIQNEKIAVPENRTGFYRAIVVQNTDPLNIARIRVRVPAFHGVNPNSSYYIEDKSLPFAYPASFNGAGFKSGSYVMPNIGSLVWVSFETGTENLIYFGGIYCADPSGERYIYFDRSTYNGEAVKVDEDDLGALNHPNRYVLYKSIKGSQIIIDDRDKSESVSLEDPHGNKILMNQNGVTIQSIDTLKAPYPYLKIYYMSIENVDTENAIFDVKPNIISLNKNLNTDTYIAPIIGSRIIYLENGNFAGSGIVLDILISGRVQIGTTGLRGGGQSVSGTNDYNKLKNRPSINEVVLEGNINLPDTPITNIQLENMLK